VQEARAFDPRVRIVTLAREHGAYTSRLHFEPSGEIGRGGNSGFQALNLALQFGARRIVLLGFDMRIGPGGAPHHHGAHKHGLRNPTPRLLGEWARILDGQAPELQARGVEVINASVSSILKGFQRRTAHEVIAQWADSPLPVV
jgi:hypothetical protein